MSGHSATGSVDHVIPVALTQIASNSSLHCVTEWISPVVKLSSHGSKAARLIPLPTDCQHVLAHTEPLCGSELRSGSQLSAQQRARVFIAPWADTKACPRFMHIMARRAAMRGFSGSTVLSSSAHTGSSRLCTMDKLSAKQVVFNKPKVGSALSCCTHRVKNSNDGLMN